MVRLVWILAATAPLQGCFYEFTHEAPPDMQPLWELYENPDGLLASADIPGLLLTLDDLLDMANALSRTESLAGLMETLQHSVQTHLVEGSSDAGKDEGTLNLAGVELSGHVLVQLNYRCDESTTGFGQAQVSALVSQAGLSPVVWSTFDACLFILPTESDLPPLHLTIDGPINVLIKDPPTFDNDAKTPTTFLMRSDSSKRLAVAIPMLGDRVVQIGGFDFRKASAQRLEIRLGLTSGSVIFFEENQRLGFRGRQGEWECDFSARRCALSDGSGAVLTW